MAIEFILVRHAESAPDRDIPEPDWPLSDTGFAQADALVQQLESSINQSSVALFASPFLRAQQTLVPLSEQLGLSISILDEVRERKLSGGLVEDWQEQLKRSWADHDYCLPGGESARECQQRVIAGLNRVATTADTEQVIVGSHGNAISLFLNHLDPLFGYDGWRTMGNPAVYRLRYDRGWRRIE